MHHLCDVAHKVQLVLLHAQCGDDVWDVGQGQGGSELYSSAVAPTSEPDFPSSGPRPSVQCSTDMLKMTVRSHLGPSYSLDDTVLLKLPYGAVRVPLFYGPRTIY